MLDLNDLYYFSKVVERGGFTAASRTLGVTKSLLSRRIQNLEKTLGVVLLRRTSRTIALTNLGAEFYHRCRAVSIEAEEAEHVVRRLLAEPVGPVRFSCPVVLGQHVLADLLPKFMRLHPRVEIVERLTGAGMELFDEGFDLALRVHGQPLPSSNLVQRRIGHVELLLVSSPSLFDGRALPTAPEDLHGVAGLARDSTIELPTWDLIDRQGRQAKVPFRPVLHSNDWTTIAKVAMAGIGVAAIPSHVCRNALATGELIHLIPDWRADRADLTIIMPSRRGVLPAVRALADFMAQELPRALTMPSEA